MSFRVTENFSYDHWEDTPSYVFIVNKNVGSNDKMIANFIGIDFDDYKTIMEEQFDADILEDNIFFCNISDVEKAIDWLEACLVAVKLRSTI